MHLSNSEIKWLLFEKIHTTNKCTNMLVYEALLTEAIKNVKHFIYTQTIFGD